MRTRLRICKAKLRYADEAAARIAAEAAGWLLRPYRCDRCGLFHLSSRRKGKRRPRPEAHGNI